MPFCQHCGTKIQYCPSCGEALEAGASPTRAVTESYEERVLWEGKPHAKAGAKALTTTYRVTTERVAVIYSALKKRTEEIELARLKDVQVKQSLAQRAMGVGDVTIISSDSSAPVVIFQDVSDPGGVKEIVRKAARAEMQRLGVKRYSDI